jgi:Na+-driven multidrug efflux pump
MAMQLLASVMLAGSNLILAQFGAVAIAVFGVFFRLQSFILMPIFGLGQAVMPMVGYNYGSGKPQRLLRTVEYGAVAAFTYAAAGFALFQIIPGGLIRMFNQNPELVEIGTTALPRLSIGFLFIGFTIISANLFQSVGKGLPSFLISVLRTLVLLLPIMYLLGEFFGLAALWFAFPIAEVLTMLFAVSLAVRELRAISRKFSEPNREEEAAR